MMSAHPHSWVVDNLLIQQDHGDGIFQARKVLSRAPGSLAFSDASSFVSVTPRASEFGALAEPTNACWYGPMGVFCAPVAATGFASNFCASAKVPGELVLALAVFPAEENVRLVGRWWSCRGRSRDPRLIRAPLTAASCLAPALVIGAPGPHHLFLATCVWRPTDEGLRLNNLGAPQAVAGGFAAELVAAAPGSCKLLLAIGKAAELLDRWGCGSRCHRSCWGWGCHWSHCRGWRWCWCWRTCGWWGSCWYRHITTPAEVIRGNSRGLSAIAQPYQDRLASNINLVIIHLNLPIAM